MARVTSVPPEEAVPAEDLEAATEDAAPRSSGWGQRMRRLVPTRTIDTRSAIERLWDAPPRDARLSWPVSYTHLRAHETDSYLVCRLLLEKKKNLDPTMFNEPK